MARPKKSEEKSKTPEVSKPKSPEVLKLKTPTTIIVSEDFDFRKLEGYKVSEIGCFFKSGKKHLRLSVKK